MQATWVLFHRLGVDRLQVDVLLPAVQRLEDALVQDTAEARAREEQPVPPEP